MMKVISYMAITPNGFIARKNDDTSFVTGRDFREFTALTKRVGNVIIGMRTYVICKAAGQLPFSDALHVVMTRGYSRDSRSKNMLFTSKSPAEIIRMLKGMGFKTALVGGGAHVGASFMKAGLIDELYLDVMPAIFCVGVPLFAEASFEYKLKMLGSRRVSKNEVLLRYRVVKRTSGEGASKV